MSPLDTPRDGGYGWTMDDSERLSQRVARRVAEDAGKARVPKPVGPDITAQVLAMAKRAGVPNAKLRPATDSEMEAKERETHRERLRNQADIMARRIPELYREARLPATPAGAIAAKWLRDFREGRRQPLGILGPTGTGKTWVALALARQLLVEDHVPCMFITASDLMAELRPSTVPEHTGLELAQFVSTPVLIIDDLGAEKISEWTEEQLYRLANARASHLRPMVITSNLAGPELRKRYGERIIGRLFGGAALIVLDGDDRRQLPAGF